ncbi:MULTISPECIES: hypothetical protein [unclassified Bradyrhizobium]|uniref:hypothetical protein n=1 Tax=unclassified Bradyrhizobium TaxID=2631580 RepID=UPI0012EC1E99|nr:MULTISPECIES: hypothetical protein [unclassified Bradyrhizobium]MCP3465650.1 hypothetical protein [Bradyrhizobium sp. CCGUVB23]
MSLKRLMAIVVTTLLGAVIGLVFGFLHSGLVGVSLGFYYWITYPVDSFPWPILGGLVGGLASLALHLWLPEKGTTSK